MLGCNKVVIAKNLVPDQEMEREIRRAHVRKLTTQNLNQESDDEICDL
mgnify:CR=1 FL=1